MCPSVLGECLHPLYAHMLRHAMQTVHAEHPFAVLHEVEAVALVHLLQEVGELLLGGDLLLVMVFMSE